MSNFFPDKTGLNYTMWISTMSGKEKHWARIKLSNTEGYIEVSIWGEPKIKEVQRISKPSRRIYKGFEDIHPMKGGFGKTIFSTPKGILTDRQAIREKVGGEVLFKIW